MIRRKHGYYWARRADVEGGEYNLVILSYSGSVYMTGTSWDYKASDFTDWVGPIEPPSEEKK